MISDDLQRILDDDDSGLLDLPEKPTAQTSDQRLVSSFLEIVAFFDEHGRPPSAATSSITERRLYSRLMGMQADPKKVELLKDFDKNGLLVPTPMPGSIDDILADDDDLFGDETGILTIRNVPEHIEGAEYIGRQKPSKDFTLFEGRFVQCHQDLESGQRIMRQFTKEQQIEVGQFFILKGVMVYVAEVGERTKNKNGKTDARLRLIYENGTESDILLRSLARELYRDGRRITEHDDKLMANFENIDTEDVPSGYIYILSSLSENPEIAELKNLYKIGFSTQRVEDRIKNAAKEPTYLMAPVKIIASYKCFNMTTQKFEHLLHRVFARARLQLEITDPLHEQYIPDEWFIVPLDIIDQAIQLIINGEIVHYEYDASNQDLMIKD
jgi:hypothetical protein